MNQRTMRLLAVFTVMTGFFLTGYGLLGFGIVATRMRFGSLAAGYMFLVAAGLLLSIAGLIARRRFGGLSPSVPRHDVESYTDPVKSS